MLERFQAFLKETLYFAVERGSLRNAGQSIDDFRQRIFGDFGVNGFERIAWLGDRGGARKLVLAGLKRLRPPSSRR